MIKYNIQIILGSTRPNRRGEVVAKWALGEIKKHSEIEAELLDLRDWPLPFFNEVASPDSLEGKYSVDIAKQWAAKVGGADGFIIVTPEYNHGYPAVLKNALDYAYSEWNRKPVAFISYGGASGGARSVEQLRQVVVAMEMVPVPKALAIASIKRQIDENGQLKEQEVLNKKLSSLFEELLWWVRTLKHGREG